MPTIITIANQKGGVGKTTLTSLLALSLKDKYNTAIIDTDPQLSLYNHVTSIKEIENIEFNIFKEDINGLKNNINKYDKYDVILIDTLPTTDVAIIKLFNMSALVLIPVGTSSLDVVASLETVEVLKSINKEYRIVFNNVRSQKDLAKIKESLEQSGIKMADNYLTGRLAFSRLFANNLIVDDEKAKLEVDNLLKELM